MLEVCIEWLCLHGTDFFHSMSINVFKDLRTFGSNIGNICTFVLLKSYILTVSFSVELNDATEKSSPSHVRFNENSIRFTEEPSIRITRIHSHVDIIDSAHTHVLCILFICFYSFFNAKFGVKQN